MANGKDSYWESDKDNPSNKILRYKSKTNKGGPSKNNIKEGGLLKKWMGKMTDDKGLFQGGMKKRLFGRAKDAAEERFVQPGKFEGEADISKKDRREYSEDIRESESLNTKAGYDMYESNVKNNPDFNKRTMTDKSGGEFEVPAYSEEFSYAREFALDFNPKDKNQVLELQRRLNNAGYLGSDGKPLAVDGILGNNTMHGLRGMQNDMKYETQFAKNVVSKQIETNANSNAIDNVQRWLKEDQKELEKKINIQKLTPTRFDDSPTAPQVSAEQETLRGRQDEYEATQTSGEARPKFKNDKPVYNPTTQVWESNKDMPNMPKEPVVPMPKGYKPSKQAIARYEAQLNTEEENPVSQVQTAIKNDVKANDASTSPTDHFNIKSTVNQTSKERLESLNNKYYPEIADELNNAKTMEEYKKIMHQHTTKDATNWDEEIKETGATSTGSTHPVVQAHEAKVKTYHDSRTSRLETGDWAEVGPNKPLVWVGDPVHAQRKNTFERRRWTRYNK